MPERVFAQKKRKKENRHFCSADTIGAVEEDGRGQDGPNLPQRDQSLME